MIQKRQNIFLYLLLVHLFLFLSCTHSHRENHSAVSITVDDESVLKIAVESDVPGFFEFHGQRMGYVYDLLEAYAQSFDKKLQILPVGNPSESRQALSEGQFEMIATIHPYLLTGTQTVIPLYESSFVVLATTKKIRSRSSSNIFEWMDGHQVRYSNGFLATRAYDELHDLSPRAHLASSDKNTFALLEDLINNRIDFLICERSEALLGCSLIRNIETVHQFDETVAISAVTDPSKPGHGRRFTHWLYNFRQSDAAGELYAYYFGNGITRRIISGGVKNRPAGATSVYDDLFKQVSREEKLDWRLVSAIAFSESKYNPYLVSPRGARGLMQVMPATARAFDVPVDQLMDPEANVRVAVKLIRQIEKSLKFASDTPSDDRTYIMLACYNAGIGHVMDARRLAKKHGGNPDRWSDVSRYLRLKSDPQVAADEVVQCGAFKGAGETLKFVDHVMGKYYAYCGKS